MTDSGSPHVDMVMAWQHIRAPVLGVFGAMLAYEPGKASQFERMNVK